MEFCKKWYFFHSAIYKILLHTARKKYLHTHYEDFHFCLCQLAFGCKGDNIGKMNSVTYDLDFKIQTQSRQIFTKDECNLII